ncbi:MAG: hypothetical protein DRG20_06295 [Deltaproteobacteria bacterium]|nr:MAG: hypothetical protein DRG20_06295 [Deltaproteobacteria bacterium]
MDYLRILLVPIIVGAFTTTYYIKNRGLPSEDLLLVNPLIYSIAIILVIVIFNELKVKKNELQKKGVLAKRNVTYIFILIIILYLISMNFIGYLISTILFLVIGLYILGVRKKRDLILLPLSVAFFFFFLFSFLLHVPLPLGPESRLLDQLEMIFR